MESRANTSPDLGELDDDAKQQSVITTAPDARLLVGAGPGTGKTAVACARIAKLIDTDGVEPTIQLQTLRKLAEALGCRVVYAVVPPKPLPELRRDRARAVARRRLQPVCHPMKLEAQGVSPKEEQGQLELLIQKLLAGNPKQLWD